MMTIEDTVSNGSIVGHVQMISFELDGQRLECVYSKGELTIANLSNLSNGNHKYLTKDERDAIVNLVRERIGEAPVVSY